MRIYVRTRGRPRDLDYRFLGEAPEKFWWRSYRPVTDIERPTILVESDGTSWQAYIAGIRSQRLDSTENPIQFNLVLTGECAETAERELELGIITQSAADFGEQEGTFIPGRRLDARLPQQDVEQMMGAPGEETLAAAEDAVRAAYAGRSVSAANAEVPPDGDWIGGLTDPAAQAAFAALAGRLLGGRRGRALVLNLLAGDEDIERLPEGTGDLGVLIARPGPRLGMEVRRLGKVESPPAPEPGMPGQAKPGPVIPPGVKVAILAGGAVLLALLIDWLIRTWEQHPHR